MIIFPKQNNRQKSKVYLIKRWLLDFVYPNRCPFCDTIIPFDEYFCSGCGEAFTPPPKKEEHPYLDDLVAVTSYDSVSRPFVMEMKNNNNGYALSAASSMIFKRIEQEELLSDVDVITFIPMRKRDIRKRGYNQTKLIAKEISGLSRLPCRRLIDKIKDTEEQKKLSAEERRKNVKGVFSYCSNQYDIKGKNVLIIDDVCTTGSTLSEAARILRDEGAKKVFAAVFAKTVIRS